MKSTFAIGLSAPFGLAFQRVAPQTPEPGAIAILASMTLTGAGFLAHRRKKAQRIA